MPSRSRSSRSAWPGPDVQVVCGFPLVSGSPRVWAPLGVGSPGVGLPQVCGLPRYVGCSGVLSPRCVAPPRCVGSPPTAEQPCGLGSCEWFQHLRFACGVLPAVLGQPEVKCLIQGVVRVVHRWPAWILGEEGQFHYLANTENNENDFRKHTRTSHRSAVFHLSLSRSLQGKKGFPGTLPAPSLYDYSD